MDDTNQEFIDISKHNMQSIEPRIQHQSVRWRYFLDLSSTETIDLTISTTETQSISKIASKCARRIGKFAEKYGVSNDFDEKKTEEDLIYFLVKRHAVKLEELEISILSDGSIDTGDVISGKRIADLILRFHYKDERYSQ